MQPWSQKRNHPHIQSQRHSENLTSASVGVATGAPRARHFSAAGSCDKGRKLYSIAFPPAPVTDASLRLELAALAEGIPN